MPPTRLNDPRDLPRAERAKYSALFASLTLAGNAWAAALPLLRRGLTEWALRPSIDPEAPERRREILNGALSLADDIMKDLLAPGDSPDADIALLRRIQDARKAWDSPGPAVVEAVFSVLDAAAVDIARSLAARPRELSQRDRWGFVLVHAASTIPALYDRIGQEAWVRMSEQWKGRESRPGRGVGYSAFGVVRQPLVDAGFRLPASGKVSKRTRAATRDRTEAKRATANK